MKYTILTSFLAPAAVLAGVIEDRFELSDMSKMSLTSGGCKDIGLFDNHILKASCTGWVSGDPNTVKQHKEVELNLDLCFANYLGTLNRAYVQGGFSDSCEACVIVENTKLRCACKTGLKDPAWKTNFVDLDNWRTVHVGWKGDLDCDNTDGFE